MDIRKKLHLVIYRVRERGLEIFVRDGRDDQFELPEAESSDKLSAYDQQLREFIELNDVEDCTNPTGGYAVEGDYHDIPSLKKLLLDDARKLRDQIKERSAGEGRFVAVRETAQRLLPEQYEMLRELKDILIDRNSTKNI